MDDRTADQLSGFLFLLWVLIVSIFCGFAVINMREIEKIKEKISLNEEACQKESKK